jgi:sirohydrochlorin cobaltochelatase
MTDAPASSNLPITALTTRDILAHSLREGRLLIGEILLGRDFSLRHVADADCTDLISYFSAIDARALARYDEEGNFRPLKTAPNLRKGWLLQVTSLEEMELALEFFYPSALGLWLSSIQGRLHPTSLRETLDRQTGMYRVTRSLTPQQASELIARTCTSHGGCLRTILWDLASGVPIHTLPAEKLSLAFLPPDRIPLICRELCNLVVAAARPIAKGNLPMKEEGDAE